MTACKLWSVLRLKMSLSCMTKRRGYLVLQPTGMVVRECIVNVNPAMGMEEIIFWSLVELCVEDKGELT